MFPLVAPVCLDFLFPEENSLAASNSVDSLCLFLKFYKQNRVIFMCDFQFSYIMWLIHFTVYRSF